MKTSKKRLDTMWPWAVLSLFVCGTFIAYLLNFHGHQFSDDPSHWGAIGDYFGGLANPLISAMTLYFLIKAYTTQKEELSETKEALKKTEEHSRDTAAAQKQLVDIQKQQSLISKKLMNAQILSSKVSAKNNKISILQTELGRCTDAIVNNKKSVDLDGRSLPNDSDLQSYRMKLINDIRAEIKAVDKIISQFEFDGID